MLSTFSTHHSLSRSILTADKPKDKLDINDGPISIFTIAKHHDIKVLRVIEDSWGGFYELYKNSEDNNIQLIFGLNVEVVSSLEEEDIEHTNSTVTLWIKNSDGYQDLLNINYFIENEGFNKQKLKGYITWNILNKLITKNILVTIPFYSGFLYQNLTKLGHKAIPQFDEFTPIFLIENHNLPFDKKIGDNISQYCHDNYYDYCNSHLIYYYQDHQVRSLQVARCIAKRSTFEKPELPHFASDKFSFQSLPNNEGAEIFDKNFSPYKINDLKNGVRLPEVIISKEDKEKVGLPEEASNYDYLLSLIQKGLKSKILSNPQKKEKRLIYINRCKEELTILKQLNIVDYILLVADILNWCLDNKIPIGAGRGSSAGSCVAYLLNIVDIDPIEHSLYFSRFISSARTKSSIIDGIVYHNGATMPDVDSDISYKNRERVIEYITSKYKGRTAKIGTTTTLTGKILIKEVSKIYLNYSETDAKHLSDMVDRIFGVVVDLSKAYEENKTFRNWVESSEENKICFEIAKSLENLIKNRGQHASGLAISFGNINDIVPIIRSTDGEQLVTAYDMQNVANVLVKVDILGLKTLDVLSESSSLVGIDFNNIDINDTSIYSYLKNNNTYHGLFQIEKGLGKNTVLQVKPENINDYAACVAIGRPGSMKYIPDFIRFKETGEYKSIHPLVDKYLKLTGNIIIYQEQINEICLNVYGMKDVDADQVRYAIGKKKREEIVKWEPVIYSQGELNNIPKEVTDVFWSTCNASADYLFNKSHSYCYASLSARTTYMKANYPLEFFLSLLRMAKHEPNPMEEIGIIQRELVFFGIELLPPSIKDSHEDFEIEGKNIRFGLSSIKGISDAAIKKLASFDRRFSTKFELFNNCLDAKLGLTVVSSLIQAGCFPDYKISRAKLLLEFQTYNLLKSKEKILVCQFADKFDNDLFSIIKYLKSNKDSFGKEYLKESRVDTIKKDYINYHKIYLENKNQGKLLGWLMENKCLGYSYSGKLVDIYKSEFPDINTVYSALTDDNNTYHTVIGIVKNIKEGKSKANKTPYIKFELYDDFNMINIMAFKDKINFFLDEKNKLITDDTLAVVRIKKMDGATGFTEKATVLWDTKLISRINQIKEKSEILKKDEED